MRTPIRIFAGCPSDVNVERDALRGVIEELNKIVARDRGYVLELVTWEDVPPSGGRPEAVILDHVGDFDIFIGIMGRRFGSATGKCEAGTEEEYYTAYSRFMISGKPKIMFYFSQQPAPPPRTEDEVEQLWRVLRFRRSIEKRGLIREFSSPREFTDTVRQDLTTTLSEWKSPGAGEPPHAPASLKGRFWDVWRDAALPDRVPGESVEISIYKKAKLSVHFLTISGRSIYNTDVETVLTTKSAEFKMKLLLFDWNSPHFTAKMKDERRLTATEIGMARQRARDIARSFVALADGLDLQLHIKLYSEYPVWRTLIVDASKAYAGYYLPGKRGYEGPMAVFDASDETGLYLPLNQHFDRLWDASGAPLRAGDSRFEIA